MPIATTQKNKLFFRKTGDNGKTIVIIHGLYGSSDNWMTVARKLSETNVVYCIDQRNHGRSPHFPVHDYESMKEDLASFFIRQHIDKAIVIGHSMGGKAAMLFAAEYPNFVEQLVVVDICPKDYLSLGEGSQVYEHRLILETLMELQHLRSSFNSKKEIVDFLKLKLGNQSLVLFLSKSIPWNREKGTFDLLLNVEVLYDYLDEIINGVNELKLASKAPISTYDVLFIRGLNSSYISDNDIPLIKHIYPYSQIADIPNAGHWLHAEQPQLFMKIIQNFINQSE
ncbi:MAG: alpha/beta fold hydrolase [Mangrovibacterium sp.]